MRAILWISILLCKQPSCITLLYRCTPIVLLRLAMYCRCTVGSANQSVRWAKYIGHVILTLLPEDNHPQNNILKDLARFYSKLSE